MGKICGVYKITNTVTGDFYIGSSKDVKQIWSCHKCQSTWNEYPKNYKLYKDMQKYGVDKFEFQILANVEVSQLKEKEQEFIEKLQPTYNKINAKGLDVERHKAYRKAYHKSYMKSHKDEWKEYYSTHQNQLCCYNGEILTLNALSQRFRKAGIEHQVIEAKKYIVVPK